MAVVKADAYGHGAVPVARALEEVGADYFCVAIAEEGVSLRRAGVGSPILMLNYSDPRETALHRGFDLTPTIFSLEHARALAAATRSFSPPLRVHLKIDTGLTRLGILPEEIPEAAAVLSRAPGLKVEAVFTHFSHGDDPDDPVMDGQEALSREVFGAVRAAGLSFDWTHLSNSGAALASRGAWCDAIKPGLSLYGIVPAERSSPLGLRPALTWETEVLAVKRVPAGRAVGYGGTFVTRRPSALAVLPIGYDDGYRRSFSGRVPALLPGGSAPTVGAISMDLTVCDATDVAARKGDRVVLLGETEKGSVTVHDLARAAGTIPYEIFCGIGPRVPRIVA